MKISDLSVGERLLLDRRRKGESQRDAADRLGASLYRYRAWEGDDDESDPPRPPGLRRLKPHEQCVISRRREGTSARELADTLGVSANWLCEMEAGRQPVAMLSDYWQLIGTC